MNLELELKEARLKPYQILRTIAKREGFEMGIPKHEITSNLIKTTAEISYENIPILGAKVSCALRKSELEYAPSYYYEYKGFVFNEDRTFKPVCYRAWVVEDFCGCGGGKQKRMTVRSFNGKATAPDWFLAEDIDNCDN